MSYNHGVNRNGLIPVLLFFAAALFSACTSSKNITYFNDIPDSLNNSLSSIPLTQYTDPVIQPNDIIQVSLQTLDPQTSAMMGAQNSMSQNSQMVTAGMPIIGYLVNKEGFVELPLVGKMKVGGLTTAQAQSLVHQQASIYYKDPVVNVRFANFTVTILGEVSRPGQYVIPNEKTSLLDVIGLAGDLTIFGKRNNVMLIREENGVKKFIRFDLRTSNFFRSPYFYLKQNDVVYVEAAKSKVASTDMASARNFTILTTFLSLLIILASRIN